MMNTTTTTARTFEFSNGAKYSAIEKRGYFGVTAFMHETAEALKAEAEALEAKVKEAAEALEALKAEAEAEAETLEAAEALEALKAEAEAARAEAEAAEAAEAEAAEVEPLSLASVCAYIMNGKSAKAPKYYKMEDDKIFVGLVTMAINAARAVFDYDTLTSDNDFSESEHNRLLAAAKDKAAAIVKYVFDYQPRRSDISSIMDAIIGACIDGDYRKGKKRADALKAEKNAYAVVFALRNMRNW